MNKKQILLIVSLLVFSVCSLIYLLIKVKSSQQEKSDIKITKIINFAPSNYNNAENMDGVCWQSIASTSDNAYRCSDVNSTIHDPCFKTGSQEVACYADPQSPALAIIKTADVLVQSGSKEKANTRSLPWVSVLEGGDKCYVMTGTSVTIKGKIYHLSCIVGGDKDIYGEVVADSYPWKMRLVSPTKDIPGDPIKILSVYK